jgi:hypothetical protein
MNETSGTAPADETAVLPAATEVAAAPVETAETVPVNRVPSCGGCGEVFARAGFGGRALFLVDALRAAAVTAGWTAEAGEPEGTWTCTVCLARAGAGPEPEPAAPESEPEPAPDSDPLDQSLAILAAFDGRVPGFWADTNQSNNAVGHKTWLRTSDGTHNLAAIFGRTPDLRSDPEAAVGLHNLAAELAERKDDMHREALERLAELRRADHARHAAAETSVAA